MKKIVLSMLQRIRSVDLLRKILIRFFVFLHNFSYHWISFFSSYTGLHPKHKIVNYADFFKKNIKESDKILDIGCGPGVLANKLSRKAIRIFAIDIKKVNIEIANQKYKRDNILFIEGDATKYNFKNKFDVIILSNVLEHIDDRIAFLKNIKGLAPKILIRVPLITRDWLSVYKKECGLEYRTDDTHFIEYTEDEFFEEIKNAGLELNNYYIKFGELYSVIYNLQNND